MITLRPVSLAVNTFDSWPSPLLLMTQFCWFIFGRNTAGELIAGMEIQVYFAECNASPYLILSKFCLSRFDYACCVPEYASVASMINV